MVSVCAFIFNENFDSSYEASQLFAIVPLLSALTGIRGSHIDPLGKSTLVYFARIWFLEFIDSVFTVGLIVDLKPSSSHLPEDRCVLKIE